MRRNERRPGALRELQGAWEKWGTDTTFVATPRRFVNRLWLFVLLQFRNTLVEGIAVVGWPECPWFSRLVDRLTILAEALRDRPGERI